MEFHVEDDPDPLDIEVLETQIRHEASAAMGLGGEADLAIFVRDAGRVVAGISGWTWGNGCELQSLWVQPGLRGRGLATRLLAAAEAEAAARGCTQTVHFTYAFQARALYERNGYELVGCVEDFPSGTDVLWYRKHLTKPCVSKSTRFGLCGDVVQVRVGEEGPDQGGAFLEPPQGADGLGFEVLLAGDAGLADAVVLDVLPDPFSWLVTVQGLLDNGV